MTISQTAEYALRAVVWLGGHCDSALGTAEIARATRVPAGYLAKVLQSLNRAGLVLSAPGRNGGVRLARPPAEISVLDVVNAIDPIKRIRRCPLGIGSHSGKLCPLHQRLDRAIGLMEQAFAECMIADLLTEPAAIEPLCQPAGVTTPAPAKDAWLYGDFSSSSHTGS